MRVEDTACWMAHLRALESERPDALFRDPYARALAGARGLAVDRAMPRLPWLRADGMATSLAVRTRVFDELILAQIAAIDADAVLNLAAGLDMRPYRLALPTALVWFEADRRSLLDMKPRLGASCHVERVALDLRDDESRSALTERISAYQRVLVVSEGLLVYLDEALVSELARSLAPVAQRWVLERVGPAQLRAHMKHWGDTLGEARWRFAPEDGIAFFAGLGWLPIETRAFYSESQRLGRDSLRQGRLLHALARVSRRMRRKLDDAVTYAVLASSAQRALTSPSDPGRDQ